MKMKINIILILFVFIAFQAIGQKEIVLSGQIIDKKTKESLPHANIIYQKKSLGTISNKDGYFTLPLFDAYETDSITISYVGYHSIKTVISACIDKKKFELNPHIYKLDEVVVKATEFKLKPFMKEVIDDYNAHRRNDPHIAITYYREKAKINDRYIMFMESIGYSIFSGNQANAVPLSNYKFFCENTKCHVVNPQWVKYKDNRGGYDPQNVLPAGGVNLNVFRYFEIDGILSLKDYKKYNYKIDSSYFIKNNSVYSIGFKGNGDNGSIHVFANSRQILKIECSTNKFWSTAFHKRINAKVDIQFNYFGTTPFVSAINSYYKYNDLEHYNSLKNLLQKFNNLELSQDEYWSMNSFDHNPFINYLPEKWKNYNIPKDNDYNTIEADLKSTGIGLEEQFINYSGRWFFSNQEGSEIARLKVEELKSNF